MLNQENAEKGLDGLWQKPLVFGGWVGVFVFSCSSQSLWGLRSSRRGLRAPSCPPGGARPGRGIKAAL